MSKIVIDRSVVERALDAFSVATTPLARDRQEVLRAIEELRAALEPPQVEQEPFTVLVRKRSWLANQWEAAPRGFPDYGKAWAHERINVYTHPQNLNCKSNQARLATLWGYEKPQPPRQPLTEEQILNFGPGQPDAVWSYEDQLYFARAIERAHGITGEQA